MTTCSETLVQKLETNQDDLISKMNSMQDMVESQGHKLDDMKIKITNQDDLTGKLDSLQDLVESQCDKVEDMKMTITNQEDLTGKLDSLQDLVEDQRDLVTKQTATIERQNELIAKQSEMLATISSMVSKQNQIFLVDCFVNCSLTIDNIIEYVSYNGHELSVTGKLDDYQKEKSFNFNSCDLSHRYKPGVLTIKGRDVNTENNCFYGGLLLHCIANDLANPWHNFVTDQTRWRVSDGSTPCTHDTGPIVSLNDPYIKNMKDAGAIQIWSNAQTVTLIGTPDYYLINKT